MSNDKMTRIAIVNPDKCKPKKCRHECKKHCPVVRMGKLCIEVTKESKISFISEELCIGCGICVKKCPFEAIEIINLPKDLEKDTTHRYGPNSFKLHRLPMPRPGQVLGLVGVNGIGKSTALRILAGKLKPNLGRFLNPPDWKEILLYFRGSELQNFFTKVLEDDIKAVVKPQYVDQVPKAVSGEVGDLMKKKDERKVKEELETNLDLSPVLTRQVEELSGGELQRFAIAMSCLQDADIYMFDEPSSYLDVRQRLLAARTIRGLCSSDKYVVAVEHDLSVLDYLSDFVCCLYGKPGAYGVVTMPFSVREGINIFLSGFVPTENLRFRMELTFKVAENVQEFDVDTHRHNTYEYPNMTKTLGNFKLHVEAGSFTNSEIIVMLGQNGCGKTTFIKMLAGLEKPDDTDTEVPKLNVSYKPQKISPKFPGTVRELFHKKIRNMITLPQFVADVMKPLSIDDIIDQEVLNLSGGELQRVAIVLCLGQPADIYLIDEPSAYLDSEQRIIAAKVLKRFILHAKKTAFIVEHDFIMATYLADRVIVYKGEPAKECVAQRGQDLLSGMNAFLKDLEITFRRDPTNHRPRINKPNSVKDKEQKLAGTYFYLDTDDEVDEKISSSKETKPRKEKGKSEKEKEPKPQGKEKEKEKEKEKKEEKEKENEKEKQTLQEDEEVEDTGNKKEQERVEKGKQEGAEDEQQSKKKGKPKKEKSEEKSEKTKPQKGAKTKKSENVDEEEASKGGKGSKDPTPPPKEEKEKETNQKNRFESLGDEEKDETVGKEGSKKVKKKQQPSKEEGEGEEGEKVSTKPQKTGKKSKAKDVDDASSDAKETKPPVASVQQQPEGDDATDTKQIKKKGGGGGGEDANTGKGKTKQEKSTSAPGKKGKKKGETADDS